MSQKVPILDLGFIASADLSDDSTPAASKRYRAVKTDGSSAWKVTSITAATDRMIGVLQNLPKAGEFATVSVLGTTKVRAGGAIAANAYAKLDAGGKFVAGGAVGDINWAIALEAATADGDVIEALLLQTPRAT